MFFKINFIINLVLTVSFLVFTVNTYKITGFENQSLGSFNSLLFFSAVWLYQFILSPIAAFVFKAIKESKYHLIYLILGIIQLVFAIPVSPFIVLLSFIGFGYILAFIQPIFWIQPLLDFRTILSNRLKKNQTVNVEVI